MPNEQQPIPASPTIPEQAAKAANNLAATMHALLKQGTLMGMTQQDVSTQILAMSIDHAGISMQLAIHDQLVQLNETAMNILNLSRAYFDGPGSIYEEGEANHK